MVCYNALERSEFIMTSSQIKEKKGFFPLKEGCFLPITNDWFLEYFVEIRIIEGF